MTPTSNHLMISFFTTFCIGGFNLLWCSILGLWSGMNWILWEQISRGIPMISAIVQPMDRLNLFKTADVPWFHGIFNAFSLSLVCVQKPFLYWFLCNFLLICRKSVQRWTRKFLSEKCRRDQLQSLWRSVELVTVRRWDRSEERSWWRKIGKSDLVWDYGSPRRTIISTTIRPDGSS